MTKLSTMLSNPEKYFNELIKALIACEVDSSGDDDWEIVHHIEDLPNETELLLKNFFESKIYEQEEVVIYSALWFSILNTDFRYEELSNLLNNCSVDKKEIFKNYVKDILLDGLSKDTEGYENSVKIIGDIDKMSN